MNGYQTLVLAHIPFFISLVLLSISNYTDPSTLQTFFNILRTCKLKVVPGITRQVRVPTVWFLPPCTSVPQVGCCETNHNGGVRITHPFITCQGAKGMWKRSSELMAGGCGTLYLTIRN